MSKAKAFVLSFLETMYLLAPVAICLSVLAAYGNQTIDGKQISLLTLSEWGFVSSFLYINVLRDKVRLARTPSSSEEHLRVLLVGSLVALNSAVLGLLYAFNVGLLPAPRYVDFLGWIQFILLVGSLLLHWQGRYEEYTSVPAPTP